MPLPPALYRKENLHRAWRWIRSNPDAGYKTYFREHYGAFAVAEDALLDHLGERLRRGAYQPAPACKIYLPKASGILRPYSLLEVEDQIAYQAVANLVAERLFHYVRHRYQRQVFGHLYAGKSSIWFYRKWSVGYSAFNKAAKTAFDAGQVVTASFDLTAFYDSIDHRVLAHFLKGFGLDRDTIAALSEWLSEWTGTEARILQGHGIPQGPLSSGLIAESVLSHLDNHPWPKLGVTYLRYVDDIRLFATSEHALRQALIRLDHLSKDIGLFPQSGKISIHQVSDIRDELKSVSQPVETAVRGKKVDQGKIARRLTELSPHYKVTNKTRFKFVLAHAVPRAEVTTRLWRILDRAPELYESVGRYLARASRLSRKTSREVVQRIVKEDLYPAVAAAFLRAIVGNLHPRETAWARSRLKAQWAPKTRRPDFTAALGQWLMANGALTDAQTRYACRYPTAAWLRSSLILAIDWSDNRSNLRQSVARHAVFDSSGDPAVCGALLAGIDGVLPDGGVRGMRRQAALVLKEFGLVRRAGGRVCGILATLEAFTETSITLPWKNLFGPLYRQAERQIVGCRGYAKTDATAWVQGLDVFNDYLLAAIFRLDTSLGGYTLGNIGAVTGQPSKAFQARFPLVLAFVQAVHQKRYESYLAHPRIKQTQQPTGHIRYGFIGTSRGLLKRAVKELESSGLV